MVSINKILVPVDFSRCSQVVLEHAIHFGGSLGASAIDVLHVWESPRYLDPEARLNGKEETLGEFMRSRAGQAMKEFLAKVEGAGSFQVHGRLESGPPHRSILQVAAEGYDLIIMGTRGETQDIKLGSTAQRVVRHSTCPVLTIRSAD